MMDVLLMIRKTMAIALTATAVMITASGAATRYPYNHYTATSNCFIGVKNHYGHGDKRLRQFYRQKCEAEKAALIEKEKVANQK